MFKDKFKIVDFSFVDNEGGLNQNVVLARKLVKNKYNCNCHYKYGIFELRKKSKND